MAIWAITRYPLPRKIKKTSPPLVLIRPFCIQNMSFGLCDTRTIFQRFMISIFSVMVEYTIEVFMDDFFMVGDSFVWFLNYLAEVIK